MWSRELNLKCTAAINSCTTSPGKFIGDRSDECGGRTGDIRNLYRRQLPFQTGFTDLHDWG